MSKAFTRESDEVEEIPLAKPPSALPIGAKNYYTSRGLTDLQRELQTLTSAPITLENRQRIAEIQSLQQLAIVVNAPPLPWDQVLFGATVTVRNQHGEEFIHRIVGVNETDLDHDYISWLSPMAKALLKAHIGDHVHFQTPAGEQQLKIIQIHYDAAET